MSSHIMKFMNKHYIIWVKKNQSYIKAVLLKKYSSFRLEKKKGKVLELFFEPSPLVVQIYFSHAPYVKWRQMEITNNNNNFLKGKQSGKILCKYRKMKESK